MDTAMRRCSVRKNLVPVFAVAIGLVVVSLIVSPPIFAHHGAAGYDMTKIITVTGTVTKYDWNNPHILVYADAKDPSGTMQHWSLELAAPLLMARLGWTKNSIKSGDHLVAEIHPAKNGAPIGIGGTATFLLKFEVNGTPLPHL
jgi:hypothetical protein